MNANEAIGTREPAEMNGVSRELTLDEVDMVTGGVQPVHGYYAFSLGVFNFRGDFTHGCVSWRTANGGLEAMCVRL